jgi:hypothetical protein
MHMYMYLYVQEYVINVHTHAAMPTFVCTHLQQACCTESLCS